jgi:hypothetical protein
MATNTCTNCGCKKCGCQDDFLTTPPACPTPLGCPTPEPCSEIIDAQCVIYTGLDIECGNDTVVLSDTNVADALNDVVTYFCQELTQQRLRYIKEINTNFDETTLTISQAELTACGITPSYCSVSGSEYSDFVLSLWFLVSGAWKLIQPYESPTAFYAVSVDDVTGLITISITRPVSTTTRLRAVLIF